VSPPGIERSLDLWLKLFSRASVVQLREVYRARESEAAHLFAGGWRRRMISHRQRSTSSSAIGWSGIVGALLWSNG